MASEQKSLWALESDVFSDYEGTITEASFQFSEKGNQIKFVFDEIDGKQDPQFEYYALPPGWESLDGGETITRISDDGKGITKRSQWGRFLAAVMDCGNDAKEAVGETAPVDARQWIGTRWHMDITEAGKGKPYEFPDRDDPNKIVKGVSKDKNYPVTFLGKDSASVQDSTSGSANGNGKVDSLSVLTSLNNPVVEAQIQELAKTLTHKEWFAKSYALVTEAGGSPTTHGDLISAMGDRALYESLGGKG